MTEVETEEITEPLPPCPLCGTEMIVDEKYNTLKCPAEVGNYGGKRNRYVRARG